MLKDHESLCEIMGRWEAEEREEAGERNTVADADEKLLEVTQAAHSTKKIFLFKRKFFPNPQKEISDPVVLDLLYHQVNE